MYIKTPKHIEYILDKLEENGFEAYIVGGCIRDILLNKSPLDFDVTTNALPEEIEEVFYDKKIVDIGRAFGTIIVQLDEDDVEITTFRREGDYIDGRRPELVEFVSSIENDLFRRDFTINAMAYNRKRGLVDPFNGVKDLQRRTIRCVGEPERRFQEDYLRILRAIRFACVLDFEIDEDTFLAGEKYSECVSQVSMERINKELVKILLSDTPSKGMKLLEEMGLIQIILPEFVPAIGFDQHNPHHDKDVFNHILCVVDNTPANLKVRLAALFHDVGKPSCFSVDEKGIGHFYDHNKVGAKISRNALDRLKFPKDIIKDVSILVREHMTHHSNFSDKGLKRLIRRVGEENIYDLFCLQKADRSCSNKDASIDNIIETELRVKEILDKNEAYEIEQLSIDGHDLMKIGYLEGKIIGEILEYLLTRVMEKPSLNNKEKLESIALKKFPLNQNKDD